MTENERSALVRIEDKLDRIGEQVAGVCASHSGTERRVTVLEKRINAGSVCQVHAGVIERIDGHHRNAVSWPVLVTLLVTIIMSGGGLVLQVMRVAGK